MAGEDLIGGPVPPSTNGFAEAVDRGITYGEQEQDPQELAAVKTLWTEYTDARELDRDLRKQYRKDRKYAAGLTDLKWASDANIIGAIIDILVSYLYAKDPRFSSRPARRVAPPKELATVSPLP